MSNNDATRYHEEAEQCRKLAEQARTPSDKEAWLRLAGDWLKLANAMDGSSTFSSISPDDAVGRFMRYSAAIRESQVPEYRAYLMTDHHTVGPP
jgi:hypothetical protein